MAYRARHCQF